MSADSSSKGAVTSGKKIRKEDALAYHSTGRPGKIEVVPTKPCATARDLSLAYTPGRRRALPGDREGPGALLPLHRPRQPGGGDLQRHRGARPRRHRRRSPASRSWRARASSSRSSPTSTSSTSRSTAKDIDKFCTVVKALEPTFGGINLEDIKAPECFVIEERLKREMNIPVFHDDQHGTAIISGAALLNAAELAGKKLDKLKVVVSGAGASAIACTKFYLTLGVKKENVILVDTKGVVYKGRTEGMNEYKAEFAADTKARTLEEALEGADVFLGCSVKGLSDPGHGPVDGQGPHRLRARQPGSGDQLPGRQGGPRRRHHGHRALRLPEPGEQRPRLPLHLPRRPRRARHGHHRGDEDGGGPGAGRSWPRRTCPSRSPAPTAASASRFGRDYIIPKPLDPRVLLWVAPAVAEAAMDERRGPRPARPRRVPRAAARSGRAGSHRRDEPGATSKARSKLARIVFPEGRPPRRSSRPPRSSARRRSASPSCSGRCRRSAPPSRSGGSTASRASGHQPRGEPGLRPVRDRASGSCAQRKGMTFAEARRQRARPQLLRLGDGGARRRRRHGHRPHHRLRRRHPRRRSRSSAPARGAAPPASTSWSPRTTSSSSPTAP